MLKNLLFIIACLGSLAAFSQQKEKQLACPYSEKFYGVWVLNEVLLDLSGENAELEGQAWEITKKEAEDIKGKAKFTFSPDGTCSVAVMEGDDEEEEYSYGHWKSTADCKEISMTIDEETISFGIVAIDPARLVIEPKETGEEGIPPMKMVFVKKK